MPFAEIGDLELEGRLGVKSGIRLPRRVDFIVTRRKKSMRVIRKLNLKAGLVVFLAASPFAVAQKYSYAEVEKKLAEKYSLTVVNAENGVVTQGVTLKLKKDGLVAGSAAPWCVDDYRDGRIGLGGNIMQKANCARLAGQGLGGAATRRFAPGEVLYVTKIEVKENIAFSLISDPINNVFYRAELRFQLPKGTTPDAAQASQWIDEVFSSAAPAAPATAAPAQSAAPANTPAANSAPAPIPPPPPPPQDAALPPIAPPPPPPDAPAAAPQTLKPGMTIDQVVAVLGQPLRIASLGKKQIYSYQNLKVTFVDGKATDIQ